MPIEIPETVLLFSNEPGDDLLSGLILGQRDEESLDQPPAGCLVQFLVIQQLKGEFANLHPRVLKIRDDERISNN